MSSSPSRPVARLSLLLDAFGLSAIRRDPDSDPPTYLPRQYHGQLAMYSGGGALPHSACMPDDFVLYSVLAHRRGAVVFVCAHIRVHVRVHATAVQIEREVSRCLDEPESNYNSGRCGLVYAWVGPSGSRSFRCT